MKDFIQHLEWRYAVKKFDAEKMLPDTDIAVLKQSFNLTATSFGLQPIRLVVVSDKDLQKRLLPLSYGQKQVSQASHVLVICIEKEISPDYISSYFKTIKKIRGTSDEILEPYKEQMLATFAGWDQKQVEDWARNQAYLALGNLLTICAFRKIDSCPMEGFMPAEYDELLGLDKLGLSSVLVLPVGYRAEDDMFSEFKKVRRSIDKTIIHIPDPS
ncbi:NAD(P)H-dependent oxidoreductase [Zeaxanthinibacter sp. PT1]|uniref:NAD(P)H-dependent oxidoreductase n=1 Tax=Zeaxanthinibacter TaxID=561554 RepID=UPI00234B10B3|nr:NAD(P)H-dependent oxidoreductase [Zeaxanthinibacter sp. PT1]MDC6351377.1 NAD(P)H-dependent oxidoreductase [Zeaxanthinibacter sp. PT1]